jgi:hypothetical protein
MGLSHFCNPGSAQPAFAEMAVEAEKVFTENLGTGRFRTREEILAYFGDFELVEPGLVACSDWRPESTGVMLPDALRHLVVGGLARKK